MSNPQEEAPSGPSPEPHNTARLLVLIQNGDAAGLAALLDRQPQLAAEVSPAGVSLVLWALYHRQEACARVLATAHPTLGWHDACALGDAAAVRRQVDFNADLEVRSADGFTGLHLASYFARLDVVDLLCEAGADPNAVAENASRVTPLHSAAAAPDAAVLERLLAAGANPNASQEGGWTALHAVAKRGAQDCVNALLRAGADGAQRADDGTTPDDFRVND